MSDFEQVVPLEQLPEGFARRLDDPDRAVPAARPAATVVLVREGQAGIEVLLLRRSRTAGFVPGAFVFPGGRVDREDADPRLLRRTDGLSLSRAVRRLRLEDGDPPATAYFLASVRETFEETGLLIARGKDGEPAPAPRDDDRILELRRRLLTGDSTFAEVLETLDLRIDARSLEYVAHWITPEAEPRRYDTRFFAAHVPGNREEVVAPAEITKAIWISPADALARNRSGELPMVFPTLKTLDAFLAFSTPDELLEHYRSRSIPSILPEFVQTGGGVGLRIPPHPEEGPSGGQA